MAKVLLSDALRVRIAPLTGIQFALKTRPLGVLACRDGVREQDDVLAQADRIDRDRRARPLLY